MEIDDPFDTDSLDVFGSDVELLVLSGYKAAIDGISRLDEKERSRLHEYDLDDHPEVQQEINWWDKHVEALKYHAGNMGLVSLFTVFDDWLSKRAEAGNGWKSRFENLETQVGKGPVSDQWLRAVVDARNSIVHHRGQPKFKDLKGNRSGSRREIPKLCRGVWASARGNRGLGSNRSGQ